MERQILNGMRVYETGLDGVVIIEPELHRDGRGHFFESFSQREFEQKVCRTAFVQDNEAWSEAGVIRGLHYQLAPDAQSKLVRAVRGTIRDVAVDIRRGSPTFGKYVAVELSEDNFRQLFVPRGFAHGYSVLSSHAQVIYKCDAPYAPQSEAGIRFDDPQLSIDWGLGTAGAVVSERDRRMPAFSDAYLFEYGQQLY